MIEKSIAYFDNPGPENTSKVLDLVKKRAEDERIDTIVLASTRGDTAKKAMEILKDKTLIIVGISRDRFSVDVMNTAQKLSLIHI